MSEKLVETKICKHCNSKFEITDKDLEFYEKVSPVFGGVKYAIPTPTLCPDCRQQRRLSFRNERKLYKRKCDLSGKDIISIYSPDKSVKVYEQKEWWSDKWDPMDYGRDFDFGRSFFEQFSKLQLDTPDFSLFQVNLENSLFCNIVANSKNSYLVFASSKLENCLYGVSLERCTNVVDSDMVKDSENCYECFMLNNCFELYYSIRSNDCSNSIFLRECDNCKNSLLCSDLKNEEYCIWNEKVTKNEFEIKKKEILGLGKKEFQDLKEKYYRWINKIPKCYANKIGGNGNIGDNLINCNDIINSFDCFEVEKSKNLVFCNFGVENCSDCNYSGHNISLCYESHLAIFNSAKILFSNQINNSRDIYYSFNCHSSSYLFGCVGLRNKSYCILNKQYTKEQYEELIPKIIEHMMKSPLPPLLRGTEWGEFFPSSISPFGYNETVANEYTPLKKEAAIKKGFKWSDYEAPFPKVEKIIPASKLPDNISDIPDDILNWAVECEVTKKPFKIIKQELEFYRKHNLPIPRRHPDQRHLDRMALRNPRKLYDRKCDKCRKDIKTTYAPLRSEIVYCEECYNREIY